MSHFSSGSKGSDESGTNNLVTILEGLKHLQGHKRHWLCLVWGHDYCQRTFAWVCSQFSWNRGGVQRGLQQLHDPQREAGARSARGQHHWSPCHEHEELTNEDLMELEAQRNDEERQEKEVTEELRRSMLQQMTRGLSLFGEVLLDFWGTEPIKWYRKVAAAIRNESW